MYALTYLSSPYSSTDPLIRSERAAAAAAAMRTLMTSGRLILCPITMNHAALENHNGDPVIGGGAYWRSLEIRLASACDDLVVLMVDGWLESRGVARERALFEAAGKPIAFLEPGARVLFPEPPREPNRPW